MIRVITYNILAGGTHRVEPLAHVLQAKQPDLVGLIEASDCQVAWELARQLGMDYRLSEPARPQKAQPVAILSRLPILSAQSHQSLPLPLLEAQIAEPDGTSLTVFVTHLTATFNNGWRASSQRRQEVQMLLERMKTHRGTPHLLMGDFNVVAPGDRIKGSALLRFLTDERLYYQLIPAPANQAKAHGLPGLDSVVPRRLRFLYPLLRSIPNNSALCFLLDAFQHLYAPRGGISLLTKAGYVDSFRRLHPKEPGWTWPSALPAGRIDYIFASPELASRLCACEVVTARDDVPTGQASDHLPVIATLRKRPAGEGLQ